MKKLLLSLVLCFPLAAQVTAVKTSSTTVTAAASTLNCSFVSATPPPANGVTVKCSDGVATSTGSGALPIGATTGLSGGFNSAAGAITWIFTQATAAGPITYNVTATPAAGCPSGATCTASGTF